MHSIRPEKWDEKVLCSLCDEIRPSVWLQIGGQRIKGDTFALSTRSKRLAVPPDRVRWSAFIIDLELLIVAFVHYMVPQEVLPLISENFGIAIMPKGIAEQMESPCYSVRPFSAEAIRVTSHLVLRADQTSRLVNEFGRAFLKRVTPGQNSSGSSGQLPFKW